MRETIILFSFIVTFHNINSLTYLESSITASDSVSNIGKIRDLNISYFIKSAALNVVGI